MSEQLLDAISAIRNGDTREAQQLLTELLQVDPNNEQAWFLLSNIVESDELRTAYLSKTLALNPHHEKARQQLARLRVTAVATPQPETDTFNESDLFAALAEEDEPSDNDVMAVMDDLLGDDEVLPDWMDEIDEEPAAAEEEVMPPAKTAKPTKAELSYADRDKQLARYNQMLLVVGLFLIIALVFLILNL